MQKLQKMREAADGAAAAAEAVPSSGRTLEDTEPIAVPARRADSSIADLDLDLSDSVLDNPGIFQAFDRPIETAPRQTTTSDHLDTKAVDAPQPNRPSAAEAASGEEFKFGNYGDMLAAKQRAERNRQKALDKLQSKKRAREEFSHVYS